MGNFVLRYHFCPAQDFPVRRFYDHIMADRRKMNLTCYTWVCRLGFMATAQERGVKHF
jgi:hypothetical protein